MLRRTAKSLFCTKAIFISATFLTLQMRDFPDFIQSFIAKLSTCKLYNLYEIQHFVMKISLTVFERVA